MITPFEERLKSIDRRTLTPLVRAAWGLPIAEVSDWQYQVISGGTGDFGAGVSGVARFSGRMRVGNTEQAWSLIFKALSISSAIDDPDEPTRELNAYRSGLLTDLPGINVPRCIAAVEEPPQTPCIWMEEIIDDIGPHWSLDEYERVAFQLGLFNGAYLTGREIPAAPWLARHWLAKLVAQRAASVAQFSETLKQPLMRRLYLSNVVDDTLRLWTDRQLFLSTLDRLPQTFCHRDAFRRNLYRRRTSNGHEQIVLGDWAFSGTGVIGEELVSLISMNLGFLEVDMSSAHALDNVVFDGYLSGLNEAGWHGDTRLVRLGYTASAALRYGLPSGLETLFESRRNPWLKQVYGRPADELVNVWAALQRYLLDLADEARVLIAAL